jgi:hypothetical protein
MKVYVAGTWEYRVFATELMDYLRARGHYMCCDWTKHEKSDDASEYASQDLGGVRECEVFVMIDPATPSKGKYTEFGMAIALGRKIIVLMDRTQGPDTLGAFGHLVYLYHAAYSFSDVAQILKNMNEGKINL